MNDHDHPDCPLCAKIAERKASAIADWRAEYRKANPLPRFTHDDGIWYANGQPIIDSTGMGKTRLGNHDVPLAQVPDHVTGAYCGINRLCWGAFMSAWRGE